MKTCTKCNVERALVEFSKLKRSKDGLKSSCRVCRRIDGKAYRQANPEKEAARCKAHREANREKINAKGRASYADNRESEAARKKAFREANPEKEAARSKAYYEAHREEISVKSKAYREAYPERKAATCKAWVMANPEREKANRRRWKAENPDKVTAQTAKRRAAKLQRTPSWANLETITDYYTQAKLLEALTGIVFHVDHIVPLQGETVSGLHTEGNLQLLTAYENLSKSNKHNT